MKRLKLFGIAVAALMLAACGQGPEKIEDKESSAAMSESNHGIVVDISVSVTTASDEEHIETQATAQPSDIQESEPVGSDSTEPAATTQAEPSTTAIPVVNNDDPMGKVVSQYAANHANIVEQKNVISAQKSLPVIYITTEDNQEILSKDYYVNSVVDVFNCDPSFQLCETAQVRVRGNSTSKGDEKPYRIKFTSKQSMMGLNEGQKFKNWVLLRTMWHLVHDYMSFKLYDAMNGDTYYGSDASFVNVYVNGVFKGVYLLCEQTQVAKGRIELYEPEAGDTDVNIGYLLELDNYADGKDPYFIINYGEKTLTDIAGQTRKPEHGNFSIKSDLTSDTQTAYIAKYLNHLYLIMYYAVVEKTSYKFDANLDLVEAPELTPYEAVANLVDLNSFADMLILYEIAHDYDVGEGSQYLAVDFSASSKYPKLTWLAPWDFDWAYYYEDGTEGYFASTFQPILDDGDDRSNIFFITLMQADWFRNIVSARWHDYEERQVFENTAMNIAAIAPGIRNDLGERGWEVDCAILLAKYVVDRAKWLNSVW